MRTDGKDIDRSRRHYLRYMAVAAGILGAGGMAEASPPGNDDAPGRGPPEESPPNRGRSTVSTAIANAPGDANLNPWADPPVDTGRAWVEEIPHGRDAVTKAWYLSGHEFGYGPHATELRTVLSDIELEPPFDAYYTLDTELTYWDGTPIDAEARQLHRYLDFATGGGLFDDAETFNLEVLDAAETREWRDRGATAAQQPDPANRWILRSEALWDAVPMHPGFTRPHDEAFRDASSRSAVEEHVATLASREISFADYAGEGWGSGAYRVASADDVTSDAMTASLRRDHPVGRGRGIDTLRIQFTTADDLQDRRRSGEVDIFPGRVTDAEREQLADTVEEITQYPGLGEDQFLFNWNNPHLGRLWVRRAVLTAIDWIELIGDTWNDDDTAVEDFDSSMPVSWHVGLNDQTARYYYDDAWLDQTHTWPLRSDLSLAAEYMRRAGYTKQNGTWVGPDGQEPSVDMMWDETITGWAPAIEVGAQYLRELGFSVENDDRPQAAYRTGLDAPNLDYDIALQWGISSTDVWDFYNDSPFWWTNPLVNGRPDSEGAIRATDEVDAEGKPIEVQIPTAPGVLDAPDEAGRSPDLTGEGIDAETINLVHEIDALRDPQVTESRFRTARRRLAIYYNYYAPHFLFHQFYDGYAGTVDAFAFPAAGSAANRTKGLSHSDDLLVQAGLIDTARPGRGRGRGR